MKPRTKPWLAALLWACAGCADPVPPAFPVGTEVSSRAVALPAAGANLLWVLQPGDYLQCQSHAREIRRVQRQTPGGMGLTVVAVGGREDWAKEFLARERIDARVVGMTPRAYKDEFRRRPRSALYVLTGARVRASVSVVERSEMVEGELSGLFARVGKEDAAGSTGAREP